MRLFICLILFVLFYNCALDKVKHEREENLLYQIEWLGENHVKIHFDTLTTMREFGNCYSTYVKSFEMLNDSAWIETKRYDSRLKKYIWKTGQKRKTDTIKQANFSNESLINFFEQDKAYYYDFNKKYTLDAVPLDLEDKLQIDSIFIITGNCEKGKTHFTFKNDSIFIAKTKKQISIWLPNKSQEYRLFIPDTLRFEGLVTDSLLQRINNSVDITDLEKIKIPIGIGNAPFNKVTIFVNKQKYEANQNSFPTGVRKLINLALSIKKEDLK